MPLLSSSKMSRIQNFKTLFMIKFIACSIIKTTSLILENDDFVEGPDENMCLNFAKNFESVTLLFCKIDVGDLTVKSLMSKGVPTTIVTNNVSFISGNLSASNNLKKFPYFIIFSGAIWQDTEECILSIQDDLVTSIARIIICDMSGNNSTSHMLKPGGWCTVGSANVIYVANSHCWTLSPPYLFDRQFNNMPGCEGLEKFWSPDQHLPDHQGQMVEAVSFHRPITTVIRENETDLDKRYDGVEMNIFKVIAQQLNFTWRLNELQNETDKWGQLLGGCWKGGVMEALTTGSAEIGFATLWVSPMQSPYLDYTTSWMTIEVIFLVPKPEMVGKSFSSLLTPFSSAVWAGVSMVLMLFPLALWISFRLHAGVSNTAQNSSFSIAQCFLYTLGTITGGSGRLGDGGRRRPATRPLVACWYVFALLLCNCYNSNIVADLTFPLFEPKIDTVRQLVEERFSWGRTYVEDTVEKYLDFEKYWHRKFAENFIIYNKADEKRLVLTKKFAYYAQQIRGTNYIMFDTPLEDELAVILRVMKERLRSYRCAIAVRKNSPLLAGMNKVVNRMIEAGLVQYMKDDSVRRYQNPAYDQINLDHSTGFSSDTTALTIYDYKYMFFILFIGWCLSSICFILELFLHIFY